MMERASAKAVWRHTRGLLRPVRTLYIWAGVAVTLSMLITLAGPALVRYAVDAGIRKHDVHPLNVAALIFLGLALLKPFVVRAQILLAATAGERFLDSLRVAIAPDAAVTQSPISAREAVALRTASEMKLGSKWAKDTRHFCANGRKGLFSSPNSAERSPGSTTKRR